ncbi:MAG: PD40 domain-containing protein [Chloroflexi bacterium]|nr:PD40 domain-containing protein [Chloroflexota bacterium]
MRKCLLQTAISFGLFILIWLSACQSAAPTPSAVGATPAGTVTISVTRAPDNVIAAQASGLKGKFVFARSNGALMLQDATGANLRALITANGETLAQFPSFSPDGNHVAYSFNYFNKDGLVVQEIRVIDSDGKNARVIVSPDSPKIAFDFPMWMPDGKEIFFSQSYPIPPSSEYSEIDRVSVNGGKITTVLKEGRLAAISPDGKKIAFRRLDLKTYSSSLWIADIDGSNAKQLVSQTDFFDIFAARFAPDSQSLVFVGSGEPKRKLPGMVAEVKPQ